MPSAPSPSNAPHPSHPSSPPSLPRPLYYTFGNHMHWVDMQWLWGYDVLPGSVRDMIRLCREAGVHGNVNFDAVGYEKMAAECPEALAELRKAISEGLIEPVGCSYGQPYGLFQGGESNIRQLTYGVRAVRRLLGVRPRAFWEEEFYFFPQLPQMLAQCGYTGACLFFQWTWHTPEVPKEPHPLILWEGIDGTRIPTLPRNDLNVHQWPEDFDGLLDSPLIQGRAPDLGPAAIVQWLELMPSRDWMCRAELLLPRLKELVSDPRFEIRPRTLSQLIDELAIAAKPSSQSLEHRQSTSHPAPANTPDLPIRAYTMDDVWHGMTLGKNWDRHPVASMACERELRMAESVSALAGLFGRPYPRWDVYPTWELEEGWRELLAAQHHDNHECEGLCGSVGYASFDRARSLAATVRLRAEINLANRLPADSSLVFNPCGWTQDIPVQWLYDDKTNERCDQVSVVRDVPPFGFARAERRQPWSSNIQKTEVLESADSFMLRRGRLSAIISKATGGLMSIATPDTGTIHFEPRSFVPRLGLSTDAAVELPFAVSPVSSKYGGDASLGVYFPTNHGACMQWRLAADADALLVSYGDYYMWPDPKPGLSNALIVPIEPRFTKLGITADTPHSEYTVARGSRGKRKYPTGDWMTSPQWLEDVSEAFTSLSCVDLAEAGHARGIVIAHPSKQQWFRTPEGVALVMNAIDPWDEGRTNDGFVEEFPTLRIVPRGRLNPAARARMPGAKNGGEDMSIEPWHPTGEIDITRFGPLSLENAPNILPHAFFRESMKSGEHFPNWAGHRMFRDSQGACDHPFVIRLVEWDGEPAEVILKLAGPVALAAKTNLLGEVLNDGPPRPSAAPGWSPADTGWLTPEPCSPPDFAASAKLRGHPIPWTALRFTMRPHEIATIYADMTLGRKEWRDLDAKRKVWATIHKQPAPSSRTP